MRLQADNTRVFFTTLLVAAAQLLDLQVYAASDIRSLKHPLIGYWESRLPENGCLESYWFKEDGTALLTSGDEQLEASYEVSPQPDAQGFFKLTHRVTQSNHALDCTRQRSETQADQTSFLLFQPDGRSFIACDHDDPSLESCFGPIELKEHASRAPR